MWSSVTGSLRASRSRPFPPTRVKSASRRSRMSVPRRRRPSGHCECPSGGPAPLRKTVTAEPALPRPSRARWNRSRQGSRRAREGDAIGPRRHDVPSHQADSRPRLRSDACRRGAAAVGSRLLLHPSQQRRARSVPQRPACCGSVRPAAHDGRRTIAARRRCRDSALASGGRTPLKRASRRARKRIPKRATTGCFPTFLPRSKNSPTCCATTRPSLPPGAAPPMPVGQ